ncbi:MAG TPA: UvrD-helicase domain-containing protein, partial [Thermoleophilaceae bacterium]|nr:UvrD-helicase domain-containing protein [Thermoleophilaceae bacterium]
EDGVDVESLLVITYTERAAGELRGRIRARLAELGRHDLARSLDGAWISTIHGFCLRLLKAHPFEAGLDPRFRILDDSQGRVVRGEAFATALTEFCAGEQPERLQLLATYGASGLRRMLTSVYETLRSAGRELELELGERPGLDTRLAELAGAARVLADDGDATAAARASAAEALVLAESAPLPERLLDLRGLRARTERAAAYEEARKAVEQAALDELALRDRELLQQLLQRFAESYAAAKDAESALDFEDLQLHARDLLRDHDALREREQLRFRSIMVDEFQDTNRLQCDLVDLLTGPGTERFFVGDEFQSIYGFRHADVGVFREFRDAAAREDRVRPLRTNFRSRAEILTTLNATFGPHWGTDFQPLEPGEEVPPPEDQLQLDLNGSTPHADATAVELIVVDQVVSRWKDMGDEPFGASLASAAAWRAAEMRLLADRVHRMISVEGRPARDIVVLLRAAKEMPLYERALRERGIDTYVVGGRNFWTQQQVADLRAYLSVLANPLDEEALYSMLGSPLGGLSLDAIGLVGLRAKQLRRDPWWALTAADGSDGLLDLLPAADRERVPDLVARVDGHRTLAATVPLERLLDRVITDSGYDRRVLTLADGRRRMANVRKLMRIARVFEAEAGGDLRAFIDHLAEQDLLAAREGEAPLEAEDLQAVRLMTIHAAKGLEFPVVCVADLGRSGRSDDDALRVTEDGRVGLKIASLAGGSAKGLALEEIETEQDRQQDEEERRVFYVAMTRAREMLVLSGATDVEKWPAPSLLGVPMSWVWRGVAPGLDAGDPRGAVGTVCTPANVDELLDREARYGGALVGEDRPVPVAPLQDFARFEAAPALPVGRLSYSGLARYRACGYRFYLERVLGMRELERGAGDDGQPEPPGSDELSPLLRGTVVHELLERLDFAHPEVPADAEIAARLESYGAEPAAPAVADVARFVRGFIGTPLFERLAGADRVRKELGFAYDLEPPGAQGRSLLVNGFLDVYAEEPGRVLIVDYKTDSLEGTDAEALCEAQYSIQRLIYALAALRGGASAVEVAYCFLERPEAPVAREWAAADAAALEEELLGLAAGVIDGRFEPTGEPHLHLCAHCAGRPSLCSWDEAATTATVAAPS